MAILRKAAWAEPEGEGTHTQSSSQRWGPCRRTWSARSLPRPGAGQRWCSHIWGWQRQTGWHSALCAGPSPTRTGTLKPRAGDNAESRPDLWETTYFGLWVIKAMQMNHHTAWLVGSPQMKSEFLLGLCKMWGGYCTDNGVESGEKDEGQLPRSSQSINSDNTCNNNKEIILKWGHICTEVNLVGYVFSHNHIKMRPYLYRSELTYIFAHHFLLKMFSHFPNDKFQPVQQGL